MEIAITNVTMASDSSISLCYLQQVSKMEEYFLINQQEMETCWEAGLNIPSSIEHCRNVCATNNSFTMFRWAKRILTMFNVESYKLMQEKEMSQKFLLVRSYIDKEIFYFQHYKFFRKCTNVTWFAFCQLTYK